MVCKHKPIFVPSCVKGAITIIIKQLCIKTTNDMARRFPYLSHWRRRSVTVTKRAVSDVGKFAPRKLASSLATSARDHSDDYSFFSPTHSQSSYQPPTQLPHSSITGHTPFDVCTHNLHLPRYAAPTPSPPLRTCPAMQSIHPLHYCIGTARETEHWLTCHWHRLHFRPPVEGLSELKHASHVPDYTTHFKEPPAPSPTPPCSPESSSRPLASSRSLPASQQRPLPVRLSR